MMRLRSVFWCLAVVWCSAMALLASPASAQERFLLDNLQPQASPSTGLVVLPGSRTLPGRSVEFSYLYSFAWAPFTLLTDGGLTEGRLVSGIEQHNLMLAVGVARIFDIAIVAPLLRMRAGDDIPGFRNETLGADVTTLGDLRIIPRVTLWTSDRGSRGHGMGLAVVLDTSLPTGDQASYAGDGGFRMDPALVFDARSAAGHSLAVRVGYRIRPPAEIGTLTVDDAVTLGGGGQVRVMGPLHLAAEVFGSIWADGRAGVEEMPFEALGSVRVLSRNVVFQAGGGTGISGGVGAPDWRVVSSIGGRVDHNPDRDGDGIPNREDRCPRAAEDFDGFEDEDGCPDPDNDGDGILDAFDDCPLVRGVEAHRGCPAPVVADTDRDGDGIPDARDACPDEPGVAPDGCPSRDRDGDGVVDRDDRCPDVAGVAANDGCPWRDTPWLALVPFAFDRDTLDAAALQALQRVVDELARYNPSARIAISGHTDGLGAESYNRGLARRRADQVRDWLVQRGIAAQRIEVDALGSRQPIDLNDTEAGRAANRRAEVRILP